MLVGLGGQVLYPLVDVNGLYHMNDMGKLIPNPAVGLTPASFDQILVVVLKNHLPELLGSLGAVLAVLILVAIMAAAMSTADSNLHALSALLTHDVYDQFFRPQAGQRERKWVGSSIIALTTILALGLVISSRYSENNPLSMIVVLGLLAIAFSTQLLPTTIDMLYLKWGTRQGAIAGVIVGLFVIFVLSPFFPMIFGQSGQGLIALMKRSIDIGAWALFFNVMTFVVVSLLARGAEAYQNQ